MDRALEEIEFLALSENRVETLDALRNGPYTRSELEEITGASQPTLGRILRDFEDRRWVEPVDGGYEATATGRIVAGGITDLREIVETELTLREVVDWLPTEEMAFDLRRLRDASITTPSRTRPIAPIRQVSDALGGATHVRVVSHAFNERTLEAVRRETVEAGGTFEGVFSAGAIADLAHDRTLRDRLEELADAETATIRVYEGEIPLAVTVTDQDVHLLLRDEDGLLQAALATDDEVVHSWALDVHDRYWKASEPLDLAAFDD